LRKVTVGSNYTIAVSSSKLDVYLIKQNPFTKLEGQIISSDHIVNKISCKDNQKVDAAGERVEGDELF